VAEKTQFVLMAEYNHLMNQRMLQASMNLPSESLLMDKGAFFHSIIGTLNHILIGDILWLKRFSSHPSEYSALKKMIDEKTPESLRDILYSDISIFSKKRTQLDSLIIEWCNELNEKDIERAFSYVNFKGECHSKRFGSLILHLFLHQVHHRGQVTTLLSQEGVNFGETDLPEIIPDFI